MTVIGLLILTGTLMADITLSGDARVRPRYDIVTKDSSSTGSQTGDLYWFYRARLNVAATIGNGYVFQAQIGHNATAQWSKMGDGKELPGSASDGSAQAPSLSWMLLNFGLKRDKYGWALGRIPLADNSATDIHFYPTKVVDVPVTVNSNNAVTGGNFYCAAGPGKLSGFIAVSENNTNVTEDIETGEKVKKQDGMTFAFQYDLKVAGIGLSPMVLYGMENTKYNPMTVGVLANYTVKGTKLQAAYVYTSDVNNLYSGYTARIGAKRKIGPGTFNGYFDVASMDWTASGDPVMDYSYFWLDYSYPLAKTDMGELTFKPTWRRSASDDGSWKNSRNKIELTIEMKFK